MIELARPDFTRPGRVSSPEFQDCYRSDRGAFEESGHVFLDGCGLPARWAGRRRFVILELGLGCAINFLLTLQRWRKTRDVGAVLHYVSVERMPLSREDLSRALRTYDAGAHVLADDLLRLESAWPLPLAGLHRVRFEDAGVELTIALGDARQLMPQLELAADAVFLDGFAPDRNPAMWEPRLLQAVARRTRPDALLATYSSAPIVRRSLEIAGFEVQRVRGFGGKKRHLIARPRPEGATKRFAVAPARPDQERHATIVGGGLAGFACAQALCRRGWRVSLLEAHAAPLSGGSGQDILAQHPHISPDDNLLARLTRAAWQISALPVPAVTMGRLNVPSDEAEATLWQRALRQAGLPIEFAAWLDASSAQQRSGWAAARDALWFESMGAWDPRQLVDAWRQSCGSRLKVTTGVHVERMQRATALWQLHAVSGEVLEASPTLILANAGDAIRLAAQSRIPVQARLGQTSRVHGLEPASRAVLGGAAYACPVAQDAIVAGAWSDDLQDAPEPAGADDYNLGRLAGLLAGGERSWHGARIASGPRGTRYATPDHLPLIGPPADEAAIDLDRLRHERNDRLPLPRLPGVQMAACFGGRGLLWAPLAAEIIAASLEGEPLPIERDLRDAVDPARFARRLLRHQRWDPSR